MKIFDDNNQASDRLREIFANVPEDCQEIRLGVRVWFEGTAGSNMYILTDYLYYGGDRTRVRFTERNDQLQFKQHQLNDAAIGWVQGQPQRRSTTEFLYTFRPDEGQHRFSLNSKTVQYADRRHQQRVFGQYALTV